MSILIKGMEMPRNCDDCRIGIDCAYDESQDGYKMMGGRPRNCPLVPVPPHGRLIDADVLLEWANADLRFGDPDYHAGLWHTISAIEDAPTVIPAEEGET